MNFLVDLCVESDGLMFQRLIEKLVDRGHEVLVTARMKPEANELYDYLGLQTHVVGQYAHTREGKLLASATRTSQMTSLVLKKLGGLDGVVGNTSVEAARVGFGLGAPVHTFHDHPNPEACHQMLLTVPISTYIYAPWIIPKETYTRLGLKEEQIVSYRGFLTQAWLPYTKVDEHIHRKYGLKSNHPIVMFRESEVGAAYLSGKKDITLPAVRILSKKMPDAMFITRPRYSTGDLQTYFKNSSNVAVLRGPIPMQSFLANASLLIGGGATMCLEAAYYGTPVIACRPIKAPITDFLLDHDLATDGKTVDGVVHLAERQVGKRNVKLAMNVFSNMEFPLEVLIKNLEAES